MRREKTIQTIVWMFCPFIYISIFNSCYDCSMTIRMKKDFRKTSTKCYLPFTIIKIINMLCSFGKTFIMKVLNCISDCYVTNTIMFKGTQDWDFFGFDFKFVLFLYRCCQYIKIWQKKFLIRPLLGEIRFFRLVWD